MVRRSRCAPGSDPRVRDEKKSNLLTYRTGGDIPLDLVDVIMAFSAEFRSLAYEQNDRQES